MSRNFIAGNFKNLLMMMLVIFTGTNAGAQAPAYDDLVIESDSISTGYSPDGKNYVYLRSKRGTGGMNKTPKADSIVSLPITDIVLVFSEYSSSAIANREAANRERWENLLQTYPEFFQFETNYMNMCQRNSTGDTAGFKRAIGFYIYFKCPQELKVEVPGPAAKKEEGKPAKSDKKEDVAGENTNACRKKKEAEETVAVKEKPAKEPKNKKDTKPEPIQEATAPVTIATEEKAPKPKKEGFSKPKRAKDPKACRTPCYESGDEDLFAFFKENIPLTKKQKRHSNTLVSVVRIQLNFDGSIKKVMVQGTNENLNKVVEEAVKKMDNWNSAVKAGITVKSEVKLTLKYDNSTKAMKPFETMITPRTGSKCPCIPDSEMFVD